MTYILRCARTSDMIRKAIPSTAICRIEPPLPRSLLSYFNAPNWKIERAAANLIIKPRRGSSDLPWICCNSAWLSSTMELVPA